MKLITIISFVGNAFASPSSSKISLDRVILNPDIPAGMFILAAGKYEDVRIDSDLDGKIDFWRLKKDSLIIETYFTNGSIKEISYRHVGTVLATEIQYYSDGEKLVLHRAIKRPIYIMNFSESANICDTRLQLLERSYSDLGSIADNLTAKNVAQIVDQSCIEALGKEEYNKLILKLTKAVGTSSDIYECSTAKEFKELYASKQPEKGELKANILEAGIKLQSAQLRNDPETFKPLVSCKTADVEIEETKLSTAEQGLISIVIPKDITKREITDEKLQHELLHRMGIFEEESVTSIISLCADYQAGKFVKAKENAAGEAARAVQFADASKGTEGATNNSTANVSKDIAKSTDKGSGAKTQVANTIAGETAKTPSKSAGSAAAATTGEKYQGAVHAAAASTANVPKTMTVAQTNIPSSESLSEPIYSNPQKTPSGITTAYNNSVAQSNNVFKTANNLVGAMNTQAAATTLAAGTAQAREIASVANAQIGSGNGSEVANNSALSGIASRNSIKSNETIVEQITLDGTATRSAANAAQPSGTIDRGIASVPVSGNSLPTGSIAQATQTATTNQPSPETSYAAASVTPNTGSSGGTSLGSGQSNIQRQPANANRGSANRSAEVANSSRDELVTFISHGNYSETKRRLNQASFTKQLESQKILILDTYGNTYGSREAEVKFLDRGDRFEKQ